jgi:hypothetical protein
MKKKYSIFHIEGGLGKNIIATAVAQCIKNNYPDRELIVVGSYPEIFLNLKFVDRVYRIGNTPYFYQNYIENTDNLIFRSEPYFTTSYINQTSHLIKSWCDLFQLEYNGETPQLTFNRAQESEAINIWHRDKPIMVIQTNGGPASQNITNAWTRDMPPLISQEIAQHYNQDYHIIQVTRDNTSTIPGAEVISGIESSMMFLSLLKFSKKRFLIDSSLQHAAQALNLKSTVLWIGNSPKVLGYDLHDNIVPQLPSIMLPDSYMSKYDIGGKLYECPMQDEKLFNVEEIISSINNQ